MSTPSRPGQFAPDLAPEGVEIKLFTAWQDRPMLDAPARICAVHTNAASGEGSVDSSTNWMERNRLPGSIHGNPPGKAYYTIPHYQVDRDGRARKMLPTNRRGICNSTVLPETDAWSTLTTSQRNEVLRHPVNVSRFSIAIETADSGTNADTTISAFTVAQIERIATILAYEHLVPDNDIPLEPPKDWFGAGIGAHTDPFPYPYWTTKRGKTCPGAKKKAQMPAILARARQIVAAWSAPIPEPPEDDDMSRPYICRTENPFELRMGPGDGSAAVVLRSREFAAFQKDWSENTMPVGRKYYHPLTGLELKAGSWAAIPVLTEDQADRFVGYPDYERTGRDEG